MVYGHGLTTPTLLICPHMLAFSRPAPCPLLSRVLPAPSPRRRSSSLCLLQPHAAPKASAAAAAAAAAAMMMMIPPLATAATIAVICGWRWGHCWARWLGWTVPVAQRCPSRRGGTCQRRRRRSSRGRGGTSDVSVLRT